MTSRVMGSPEPPHPYVIERVYPEILIKDAVDLVFEPRSKRGWIAHQYGKIYWFDSEKPDARVELAIDLHKEFVNLAPHPEGKQVAAVYGIEFHPDYGKSNRYVYVCYVLDGKSGKPLPDGSRVSRFTVSEGERPSIDPKSEVLLLTFLAHGHNGGCLKFGHDGMLYISTGDAANPAPPDSLNTGQDNTDLLASILRIDVNKAEKGRNYAIPAGNPFVDLPDLRPEVYCYGLRNPWRMSFDRATGELWIADVGWELWETIHRGFCGGNFGWSIMEGPQPVRPNDTPGPTPVTPAVLALPHTESASLTGGFVYRGKRLSELEGHYIFGDWETRRIWSAKVTGQKLEPHREIALTDIRVVGFGEDHDAELYVLAYEGTIHRLVRNPASNESSKFPRKLSETGLWSSVKDQRPADGVYAFSVNVEQWVDGATAQRFIGIPGSGTVTHAKERRSWPKDTVLARTFSIGEESRKVETQLLHFDGTQWKAYAYAWNDAQSDAELIDAAGGERKYAIGGTGHTWRFHSRAQCLTCHNPWGDYALGFTREQIDRGHASGESITGNQLKTFADIGLYDPTPYDQRNNERRRTGPAPEPLVNPHDPAADLSARARSYLHVNCSHCHRFGGGGTALIDLRYELSLKDIKGIDARPSQGGFALDDPRIIAPGDPARSVLLYRMAKLGRGRMPHIGSEEVDGRGVSLMRQWIETLGTPAARPEIADVSAIDQMLTSTSGALALIGAMDEGRVADTLRSEAISRGANYGSEQVRDLFERFIPPSQRVKRLGTNFSPDEILSLKGDAAGGRSIFFEYSGGLCKSCHRIGNEGEEFGPDISKIAVKYDRTQLLDQILHPSKTIEPQFVIYLVKSQGNDDHIGFIVERTEREIVIKDAQKQLTRLPVADVRRMTPQTISAMPENLLGGLTAQQAADLLEYLQTLR